LLPYTTLFRSEAAGGALRCESSGDGGARGAEGARDAAPCGREPEPARRLRCAAGADGDRLRRGVWGVGRGVLCGASAAGGAHAGAGAAAAEPAEGGAERDVRCFGRGPDVRALWGAVPGADRL